MRFLFYASRYSSNVVLYDESLTDNVNAFLNEWKSTYKIVDSGTVTFVDEKFVAVSNNPTKNDSSTSALNGKFELKYIAYGDPKRFILFDKSSMHDLTASAFKLEKILSAGFVACADTILCHGKSLGLNITSKSEDTELLIELLTN